MLRKSIYATIAVVHILIGLAFFVGSAAFFWKWALIDFKVALNAFLANHDVCNAFIWISSYVTCSSQSKTGI